MLGYNGPNYDEEVKSPQYEIEKPGNLQSYHPYSKIPLLIIKKSLEDLQKLCEKAGYPMEGSLERNWRLPSSCGSPRPTCLAPRTMSQGDLNDRKKTLVIGIQGYNDFFSKWIADNLNAAGGQAIFADVDLSEASGGSSFSTLQLARLFQDLGFRRTFSDKINLLLKSQHHQVDKIAIPAILGSNPNLDIFNELQDMIGMPIFEIPSIPPSIPGMRLFNILLTELKENNVRLMNGGQALSFLGNGDIVSAIELQAASRIMPVFGEKFVLATGGILGGGIILPYENAPYELVFNLPVYETQTYWNKWFGGSAVHQYGIMTDRKFQPVNFNDHVIYQNVWCVGTGLFGIDFISERSFDGIGLTSGYMVGETI
jgi:glycerol-3-phosphate dehydrogenase subunit B